MAMENKQFTPAMRVVLLQDVERYPYGIVKAGQTGVVVESTENFLRVKLDLPADGFEEWGNELNWNDFEPGLMDPWADLDEVAL